MTRDEVTHTEAQAGRHLAWHADNDPVDLDYVPDEGWEPGPHNIAHDESNAMHRAIRRQARRHYGDTIAERNAG